MRWMQSELRRILGQLEQKPADALEDETLEFKGPPRSRDQLTEWATEAAVCFANQRGGTLVVGVSDRIIGRERAIAGIGDISVSGVQRTVYDSTDPHILVELEEIELAEGRVLAVHVPKGIPPHTTTAGRALIRIGSACVPLTGRLLTQLVLASGEIDLSATPLEGTSLEDLDLAAVDEARRLLRRGRATASVAEQPVDEMLEQLGLLVDGMLTRAALILLGRAPAIAHHVPQHEITLLRYRRGVRYEQREDLRGALLTELARVEDFLSFAMGLRRLRGRGFVQLEIPDLSWDVAQEAVLNAVAHRDYFLHERVIVAVRPGKVEITSPGGFLGDITPTNVLRHAPVHRNELLARSLQTVSLVNRVGQGVDQIYEGLLRGGSQPPTYSADHASVAVTLPLGGSDEFAAWVVEHERDDETLSLDDLIILRRLTDVGGIDRWAAAEHLQLPDGAAADHLADMRRRGLVVVRGRGRTAAYQLTRPLSERLRGRGVTDADRPLEAEGIRLRVLELLRERGRLTNAEIRGFSGYSRQQVLALEKELEAEGLIEFQGRGRGAHIVAPEVDQK